MTFKHILFDFDGTLIDSAPCILNCYQQVLDAFALDPAVPVTADIIGPPLHDTVAMLAGSEDKQLVKEMAAHFKQCYDQRVAAETPTYESVEQMLLALKQQGFDLYIATNKRHEPTMAVIEHLALTDLFTVIGSVDQLPVGEQKKSLLIRRIMQDHAINASEALFIGDKMDDFNAADANAMAFAAAGWGYGDWQPPYTILKRPVDIVAFVNPEHD